MHLQATGQHKNKAGLTHSPVYYPFASTHMVNVLHVQNVHTKCMHKNVHTKYHKYFRGFLNLCLLNFARNPWKLLHHEYYILANCSYMYLIGTVPSLTQEKVGKRSNFTTCPYFCCLSVVMYRKFRNVPIFEEFSPICPYFLGFRVGKYDTTMFTVKGIMKI